MPITPLPTPPQPTDTTAQFNTKAFAFVAALAQFVAEANTQAAETDADAASALLAKADALAAAAAAAAVAGATRWTSGTTYAQGAAVWSPVTFHTYRRRVAGAGTTDPSVDSTNWTQVVGTGDVSQTGVQTLTNKTLGSGSVVTTQAQGDNSTSPASTAYVDRIAGTARSINFRNRIINGDMRIDQRNSGASYTQTGAAGQYSVDRWNVSGDVTSKFSVQQNAGAVTPPTGFTAYLGATSLSAYAVPATESYILRHHIEGQNVSDLAWGTANAQTVTLSFWVRSSIAGTFGGAIRNSGNTRSYPFSYSISVANAWEYKVITIAGDTSGTWLTNNGIGISVVFSLGAGSSVSGTGGTWTASNLWSVTGATSVVGTSGATFYITGVQLEAGTVATPFERRAYGQELALCQRYFEITSVYANGFGVGGSIASIPSKVSKRSSPTITGANNSYTFNWSFSSFGTETGTSFVEGISSSGGYRIGFSNVQLNAEL